MQTRESFSSTVQGWRQRLIQHIAVQCAQGRIQRSIVSVFMFHGTTHFISLKAGAALAGSSINSRMRSRALERRDITVPSGTPVTLATSA